MFKAEIDEALELLRRIDNSLQSLAKVMVLDAVDEKIRLQHEGINRQLSSLGALTTNPNSIRGCDHVWVPLPDTTGGPGGLQCRHCKALMSPSL